MKKLNLEKYEEELQRRAGTKHEFPSERHELAWQIADYLNEKYAVWVSYCNQTYLWTGQIRSAFDSVKGDYYSKKEAARILYRKFFPKNKD